MGSHQQRSHSLQAGPAGALWVRATALQAVPPARLPPLQLHTAGFAWLSAPLMSPEPRCGTALHAACALADPQ